MTISLLLKFIFNPYIFSETHNRIFMFCVVSPSSSMQRIVPSAYCSTPSGLVKEDV
jgi:hypothetical protein